MAAYGSQPPSLAAILQTLAASSSSSSSSRYQNLGPPLQYPTPPPYLAPPLPQQAPLDELEEGEYEPDEYDPGGYNPSDAVHPPANHPIPVHQKQPLQTAPRPLPVPELHSRPASAPPKAPPVDPTTITTWPPALRHVTKLVSQNEAVLNRIRKLIAVQHQHEKQWWDGRNALVQKQKDRVEGRRKLDEVLKAVGGKVDANIGNPTAEDEAKEMQLYDKKVHRACSEMHKATVDELKGLGVPFFGTAAACLTREERSKDLPPDRGRDGEKSAKKLDEKELVELQRRMLVLLEDLCQE